jgi:hypothetical protein
MPVAVALVPKDLSGAAVLQPGAAVLQPGAGVLHPKALHSVVQACSYP